MTQVLLLGDERKGGSKARVTTFAQRLAARGCQVEIVLDRDSSLVDRQADIVIVFGGDGSLLGAARRMGHNQRPTLGINVGRLGFLTAFEVDRAEEAVELALNGKLVEEQWLLLHGSVVDARGKATEQVLCMNDVVVGRAALGGMITLRVLRDGSEIAAYRGDGVIVATAAGSTAYSMAAGGPVLTPDLAALVLTPLASQALTTRPLVIPVGQGLDIEVVEIGDRQQAYVQIDGQVRLPVSVGGRAVIRPAPFGFRHLGPASGQFFKVLRAKFGFTGLPRAIEPPG